MPYKDRTKRRIHTAWKNMIERCCNAQCRNYPWYGARGISVCQEWETFQPFYEWSLNNGYSDELTIDRIDNDGNYEPSNCRWATTEVQARNRGNNHYLECNGKRMILSDWAKELGMSEQALSDRLNSGKWAIEEALTIPPKSRPVKQMSFRKRIIQCAMDGAPIKEWESITEASKTLNIPNSNISYALASNMKYSAGGFRWKYAEKEDLI